MAGMSLLAQPYENRYDVIFSGSSATSISDANSSLEKDSIFGMQSDALKKKNALLARTLVRTTVARYQTNNNNDTVVDPRSFSRRTLNVPVGIDVEDKTRKMRHDVLSLAKRFYSSREVEFLSSIADMEARRKEFIKLWTLKEAYVKALGKGFSASPFNTFSIIRAEAAESYNLCGQAEGWKFRLLELAASSHYAAICIEGEDDEEEAMNVIVHRTIPFVEDELISDWKLL
ncbi:hypothetical protein Bca52824_066451 [Brassica carinata]|uniref:holo-[acyl-carrier-protein] synthase n=1 Tax=Brassica carinata TaxID=52824 RepID=A0A8X7UDE0_BRACI|nr:hypothetical protein Bca52824_066451 [Brassica carinata]